MKRYLTVNEKDEEVILKILRNAVINGVSNDIYQWLKRKIHENGISHNDQSANHHNELPHQRGYVSFYYENGQWMKVSH